MQFYGCIYTFASNGYKINKYLKLSVSYDYLMGSYWDIFYCVYELWGKNTNDYLVTIEVDRAWNTENIKALAS